MFGGHYLSYYITSDIPATIKKSAQNVSYPLDLIVKEDLDPGAVHLSGNSIQDWINDGVDGQDHNSHPGIGLQNAANKAEMLVSR